MLINITRLFPDPLYINQTPTSSTTNKAKRIGNMAHVDTRMTQLRTATTLVMVLLCTVLTMAYQPVPATVWRATAVVTGREGVSGTLYFIQQGNGPTAITGTLTGLSPGIHGFHVHTLGDTTDGCLNIGPHFNPAGREHGAPEDLNRHAGDLGNILADENGLATVNIMDGQIPLGGPNSVVGRAVDVHADPDDLGKGGLKLSKITGNAGDRVACGVIGLQA